jgi:hypothetical protein
MSLADATDWIREYGRPGNVWYAKRLAANDTLATDSHQAGPYISKEFLFRIFPSINRPEAENPDHQFQLYVDSHSDQRVARAVWYNNRARGMGTRNEARITRLGGKRSALLNPDSTGALIILAFVLDPNGVGTSCHAWVCRNEMQEDLFEDWIGPVDPGEYLVWLPAGQPEASLEVKQAESGACFLSSNEIPANWLQRFPTGEEIVRKSVELRSSQALNVDDRLLNRRTCEFEIFKSVEQAFYLPRIRRGFETVGAFVSLAQTILQSRKSRSGKSLELHVREILGEEGLRSGTHFVHGPQIEGGKRPDFVFPNKAAYEDETFPPERLRVLAAKTTCKDRWRQILNEANRIPVKHLLTLQEGVSEGQFLEMQEAGVRLVVPLKLHESYPAAVRPHLITFREFLDECNSL